MKTLAIFPYKLLILICDVMLWLLTDKRWEHLRFKSNSLFMFSTVDTQENYDVGSGRYYGHSWLEYSVNKKHALRYFTAQNFHDNLRGEFKLREDEKPFTGIEAAMILN